LSDADYRGKVEKAVATEQGALKERDIRTDFHIFFSFDLVNSTQYKTLSRKRWPIVISRFYELVADGLDKRLTNLHLWKYVGDELLFYKRINAIDEIFHCLPTAYSVLQDAIRRLHVEFSDTYTILSIKATVWCARTCEVAPQDIEEIKKGAFKLEQRNIVVFQGSGERRTQIDFLGPDIDLGFRIAKHAMRGRLVVSADLAYLLHKEVARDPEKTEDKLRIVSYEQLRGIWDNRRYPIIWYEEDWSKVSQSFLYDEHFESSVIESIKAEKVDEVVVLEKVYEDLDQKREIENTWISLRGVKPKEEEERSFPGIVPSTLVQIHCVAICFRENGRILIAKRPADKRRFPNKWEFGCGQLRVSETFEECLARSYEDDFKATLSFGDRLQPITTYFIDDHDEKRKIPGAIFLAHVDNPDDVTAVRHAELQWLDPNIVDSFLPEDAVPAFKDTVKRAVKIKKASESKE